MPLRNFHRAIGGLHLEFQSVNLFRFSFVFEKKKFFFESSIRSDLADNIFRFFDFIFGLMEYSIEFWCFIYFPSHFDCSFSAKMYKILRDFSILFCFRSSLGSLSTPRSVQNYFLGLYCLKLRFLRKHPIVLRYSSLQKYRMISRKFIFHFYLLFLRIFFLFEDLLFRLGQVIPRSYIAVF